MVGLQTTLTLVILTQLGQPSQRAHQRGLVNNLLRLHQQTVRGPPAGGKAEVPEVVKAANLGNKRIGLGRIAGLHSQAQESR